MATFNDLSEPLRAYCKAEARRWNKDTAGEVVYALKAFHGWLDQRGLKLNDLTRPDIICYVASPRGRRASLLYRRTQLSRLRRYFVWLHLNGRSDLDPLSLWPKDDSWARRGIDRLPNPLREYCSEKSGRWTDKTIANNIYSLLLFHRWLEAHQKHLDRLTAADVEDFFRYRRQCRSASTRKVELRLIQRYLGWLFLEGRNGVDPKTLWSQRITWVRPRSSAVAERFSDDKRFIWGYGARIHYRAVASHFCEWLEDRGGSIGKLSVSTLHDFVADLATRNYTPEYRYRASKSLRVFFLWLNESEKVPIDGIATLPKQKLPASHYTDRLPWYVQKYLEVSGANKRKKINGTYRSAIAHLHRFLDEKGIDISKIDRRDAEGWLCYLKEIRTSPVWRRSIIWYTRGYLRWLHEHGLLVEDPDRLLRRSDLPQLPKYLPRPLPAELDATLCERLRSSSQTSHLALLLLRLTGLRIGELLALPHDCVRADHGGHHLLKVPLGKLDSERLVPLDAEGVLVVEELKRRARVSFRSRQKRGEPSFLLYTTTGYRPKGDVLRVALHDICCDLKPTEPVVPHRLRHTYATALLNAGMSLLGVMKLLGHRSIQMTMRYAAVAPETIRDEYFAALDKMHNRYDLKRNRGDESSADPLQGLTDLIAWIKHVDGASVASRKRQLLVKRLHRLKSEIEEIVDP